MAEGGIDFGDIGGEEDTTFQFREVYQGRILRE
jgi:hypothetical protein